MNGVAFAWGSESPEGAAWLQTCWHCSGVKAAEGRPEVIVFVCASKHVAVKGSTKSEISDALSMGILHKNVPPPRNKRKRVASVPGRLGEVGLRWQSTCGSWGASINAKSSRLPRAICPRGLHAA